MSQQIETDRISELTNDLVSSIFNHLPVWDAFRASLVSTKWADIPPYMYRLDFDMVSMFPTDRALSSPSSSSPEIRSQYADNFVKRVNYFLHFFHRVVQIESFRVSFAFDKKHTRDLDEWVIFALRKGVKHLNITLSSRLSYCLSSNLFPECNGLVSLSVYLCCLKSGLGFHFPNLRSLKLSMILIGSPRVLEAILSSCLNLETLTLDRIKDISYVRIPRSLNRLKFLKFSGSRDIDMFEVCATNLECLHHSCEPEIVTFSSASRLTNVSFLASTMKSIRYTYGQLAYDMPELESLSVTFDIVEVPSLPKHITAFRKLKHLHFALTAYRIFDAIRITDLLKACPLLEKFHMEACTLYPKENIIRRLPLDYGVHKCLKEVRIVGFTSGKLHIEIASFILQYCVALERMVFEPVVRPQYSMPMEFTAFKWDESERAYLWSRLKNHPRSSKISMMQ